AGLSACGSQNVAGTSGTGVAAIHGKTLTVYVSATLRGASRVSGAAVVDGARLALTQIGGRIGDYRIALKVLDDATVARGGWDPGQTTLNARAAVLDPPTLGSIADVNSAPRALPTPP